MAETKTQKIARLNDTFRKDGVGGRTYITSGITGLGKQPCSEIMRMAANFDDFTGDNDPYEEHDFGSFIYRDLKINWKIDYYDLERKFHSEDPSNPTQTCRIMTIMLASEW